MKSMREKKGRWKQEQEEDKKGQHRQAETSGKEEEEGKTDI